MLLNSKKRMRIRVFKHYLANLNLIFFCVRLYDFQVECEDEASTSQDADVSSQLQVKI